jgi:hypothetical protein
MGGEIRLIGSIVIQILMIQSPELKTIYCGFLGCICPIKVTSRRFSFHGNSIVKSLFNSATIAHPRKMDLSCWLYQIVFRDSGQSPDMAILGKSSFGIWPFAHKSFSRMTPIFKLTFQRLKNSNKLFCRPSILLYCIE